MINRIKRDPKTVSIRIDVTDENQGKEIAQKMLVSDALPELVKLAKEWEQAHEITSFCELKFDRICRDAGKLSNEIKGAIKKIVLYKMKLWKVYNNTLYVFDAEGQTITEGEVCEPSAIQILQFDSYLKLLAEQRETAEIMHETRGIFAETRAEFGKLMKAADIQKISLEGHQFIQGPNGIIRGSF